MWDWSYTLFVLPDILKALKITILATFLGFAMASILGLILAICRRSQYKPLSMAVGAFVEFIRTTPLLAQLYFIFYVFPQFGLALSPLAAGVIGLGLHYSTYLSEVYRAGIDSIPQAQWEAATALSFSTRHIWLKIILPQAIPPILPVMGNYLIGMFKDTPRLSAITLVEILQLAKLQGSQYFRYLEPVTIVGLLFLILSYVSSLGIKRLEARVNH